MNLEAANLIVERHGGKRSSLVSILHEIQDQYDHLPEEALRRVASQLGMDLTEIYGVATFYKSFSLTPRGKHSVTLCLGTACHVRKGPRILAEVKKLFGIEPGRTTPDRMFSLEAVNCLGVCAIGPVMVLDGEFHGEMTPMKARRILQGIRNKENGEEA